MVSWKTILIVIAVIGIIAVIYIMSRKKSILFDFDLGGNLSDILNSVQGRYNNPNAKGIGLYVDVPLTTIIKNKKIAPTTLKNILGAMSYNGEGIIQTKPESSVLSAVTVAGKSSTPVTDTVQLLINPSSIKFLTELLQGKKPVVKYNFGATIMGKPYSFTNTSTINKTT